MQAFRWGALGAWFAVATASAQSFLPEQPVDAPVLAPYEPERGNDVAAVGFDGQVYWVVWDDDWSGQQQVYGMRVSPDGGVLDSTELRLDPSGGLETAPAISCVRGTCLVAWEDYRWGDADLRAARLNSAGQVLDQPSLLVYGGPGDQQDPDVANDGTDFLVVWRTYSAEAARVTATGQLLDASPITVVDVNSADKVHASSLAGTYLLTWYDGTGILASRVTSSGAILDSTPFVVAGNAYSLTRSVSDGTQWWVPWTDPSLRGLLTRVTLDAGVLDPNGIAVAPKLELPGAALGFDGTVLWSVWEDYTSSDALAVRVATDGGTLDPTPVTLESAVGKTPGIACQVGECLAAWPIYSAPGSEIDGAFLDGDGGSSIENTLTPPLTAASGETRAAIACGTRICLVAWEDSAAAAGSTLHAVRVGLDGTPLDATPLALSNAPSSLAVAAIPSEFLMVWIETGAQDLVRAVRVGLDGGVLDPTPILLQQTSDDISNVAAAPLGGGFAVAWEEGTSTEEVLWRPLSEAGVAGGGPWRAANFDAGQFAPALATGGSRTLLAWIDNRTSNEAVFGNFLSADGGVFAPAGFEIGPNMVSRFNNLFAAPAVAPHPEGFLIVWSQHPDAGTGPASGLDLVAARIDWDGGVLDPIPWSVSAALGNQLQPVAAYDGRGFLVAWSDDRSGLSRIEAALFDPSGAPLVTDLQASPSGDALGPALASVGPGQALLAYERFIADGGILNTRIVTRAWIDPIASDAGAPDGGLDAGGAPDAGPGPGAGNYRVACGVGAGPVPILLALLLVFLRKR